MKKIMSQIHYENITTNKSIETCIIDNMIYVDLNQDEDILIEQLKEIKKRKLIIIGVYNKKLPKYLILKLFSKYITKAIQLKQI